MNIKSEKFHKMTAKLFCVITLSGIMAFLFFVFLHATRGPVLQFMLDTGWFHYDLEGFMEEMKTEAREITFDSLEESGFLDEARKDPYRTIVLYDIETTIVLSGFPPQVFSEMRPIDELWNDVWASLYSYSRELDSQITFLDRTVGAKVTSHHYLKLVLPYFIFCIVICILVFLAPILLFVRWKMKYVKLLKNEVSVMTKGNLEKCITVSGRDEIGILAGQLEQLRLALGENIRQEEENREANKVLIHTLSAELHTPLADLADVIVLLRENYCTVQEDVYINRCMELVKEIETISNEMFAHAKRR